MNKNRTENPNIASERIDVLERVKFSYLEATSPVITWAVQQELLTRNLVLSGE